MEQIQKWRDTVLANYLKKHGEESLSESTVNHILDWMHSADASLFLHKLQRISVPQALEHADKWVEKLNRHIEIKDDLEGLEVVHTFDNNYKIVKILNQSAYEREGKIMGHCVASYFGKTHIDIFSLRDEKNQPHCTFELRRKKYHTSIEQIKGKGNQEVAKKYRPYVIDFLKNSKVEIDEINSNELSEHSDMGLFVLGRNFFDFEKGVNHDLELKGNIKWNAEMDKKDIYPDILKVKGDFTIENLATTKSYALFSEIHISGNLYVDNVQTLQRLALKVFVDGDVEITNCANLLKLGDEVYVGGNASASDCPELKCFGNSGLINKTLMTVDCKNFQKKITQKVIGKVSIY